MLGFVRRWTMLALMIGLTLVLIIPLALWSWYHNWKHPDPPKYDPKRPEDYRAGE